MYRNVKYTPTPIAGWPRLRNYWTVTGTSTVLPFVSTTVIVEEPLVTALTSHVLTLFGATLTVATLGLLEVTVNGPELPLSRNPSDC